MTSVLFIYLNWSLPAWIGFLLFSTTYRKAASRHIFADGGACGDGGAFANGNWRDELRIWANKRIVFYNCFKFISPIVITSNGASAHIHMLTNGRIAHIALMIDFATNIYLRIFKLYKITNMRFAL